MAPAVDLPPTTTTIVVQASSSESPSQPDDTLVRDIVNTFSAKAVGLYESTKEVSPTLKTSIEAIETRLTPLKKPVIDRWMVHGDPLISLLDTTVSEHKHVVIGAVNQFNETIVKPAQARTERVVQVAEDSKAFVKESTAKAINTVCLQAEQAIDSVLPKTEREPISSDPVALAQKVSARVIVQATEGKKHVVHKYSELRQIGVEYAEEKYTKTQEQVTTWIDRVITLLPNEETTAKLGSKVVELAPTATKVPVAQAVEFVSPFVTYAFLLLLTLVLAVKSRVAPETVVIERAPTVVVATTIVSTPVTTEAPVADQHSEDEHEDEQASAEATPARKSSKKKEKAKKQEKQA